MNWIEAGAALETMRRAGWSVTLACWAEIEGRWLCDAQIGPQLEDTDFTNESSDPLEAIRKTYEQWREFTAEQKRKGNTEHAVGTDDERTAGGSVAT